MVLIVAADAHALPSVPVCPKVKVVQAKLEGVYRLGLTAGRVQEGVLQLHRGRGGFGREQIDLSKLPLLFVLQVGVHAVARQRLDLQVDGAAVRCGSNTSEAQAARRIEVRADASEVGVHEAGVVEVDHCAVLGVGHAAGLPARWRAQHRGKQEPRRPSPAASGPCPPTPESETNAAVEWRLVRGPQAEQSDVCAHGPGVSATLQPQDARDAHGLGVQPLSEVQIDKGETNKLWGRWYRYNKCCCVGTDTDTYMRTLFAIGALLP